MKVHEKNEWYSILMDRKNKEKEKIIILTHLLRQKRKKKKIPNKSIHKELKYRKAKRKIGATGLIYDCFAGKVEELITNLCSKLSRKPLVQVEE